MRELSSFLNFCSLSSQIWINFFLIFEKLDLLSNLYGTVYTCIFYIGIRWHFSYSLYHYKKGYIYYNNSSAHNYKHANNVDSWV